jgi:hypothetical protein
MEKVAVHKFDSGADWVLDLFFVSTDLLESAWKRKKTMPFLGADRAILTAEDMILLKLLAWRRKDAADMEDLVRLNAKLDRTYVMKWAGRMELTARMEEFFREIDSSP